MVAFNLADAFKVGGSDVDRVYLGADVVWQPDAGGGGGYADVVMADNPLAYYPLEDASGTVMTDVSGNGRNGTYGAAVTLGAPGLVAGSPRSISTTGAEPTASVPAGAWQAVTEFTAEVWFTTDSTSGGRGLFTHANFYAGFGSQWSWLINRSDNRIEWGVFTSAGNYVAASALTTIVIGQVHHVAITLQGTEFLLYFDGVEVDSRTVAGTLNPTPDFGLGVGGDSLGRVAWQGDIAHAAFYDHALTPGRIAAHYAAGS